MAISNQHIAALTRSARPDVVSAIRQASAQTGVDFAYLLEKASAESSLNPQAQAQTSSASGLYQFVDRTWLETMDKHGAEHGYPNVAQAITQDAQGNPVVTNTAAEQYILEMRNNPRISALMAAEFAQDNRQLLEQSLGREVNNAELYMAHFLGAGGAAKFLSSMATNPDAAANGIVPAAAQANMSVFYQHGKALTLAEVFARFEGKFSEEAAAVPQALAGLPEAPAASAEAAILAASDPAFAALQALQAPGHTGTLRADMASQLFTLSLLQAFNPGEDDRSNEWVV